MLQAQLGVPSLDHTGLESEAPDQTVSDFFVFRVHGEQPNAEGETLAALGPPAPVRFLLQRVDEQLGEILQHQAVVLPGQHALHVGGQVGEFLIEVTGGLTTRGHGRWWWWAGRAFIYNKIVCPAPMSRTAATGTRALWQGA